MENPCGHLGTRDFPLTKLDLPVKLKENSSNEPLESI